MHNQHSRRLLVVLLLASVALFVLEWQLTAQHGLRPSGLFFLPFLAGLAWLPLRPLAGLAGFVWVLAAISAALRTQLNPGHAGLQLLVETAAIGLCLWTCRLRCRLDHTRALLEQMQRHAPVGIALLDAQGRIRELNPAMADLLGYAPGVLVGQPWEAFCSHRPQVGEPQCQQLRSANGWRHVELVCRTWSGGGTLPEGGLLIQAVDCQQRVDALNKLETNQNQLQQSLRTSLMGSFLVHEIKQPLAALLLQCRSLLSQQEQEPDVSTRLRPKLDALLTSAEQLQETVDAVTALLRKGTRPPSQPIDLCALLSKCLAAQQPRLSALAVSVLQSGCEQRAPVWCEQGPLQILVANLLRNALEALETCPTGERTLQLVLRRLPPNVELTISDSGPGLPSAALEALQLRSSKPTGLGLGLFTAETIARQQGGSLQGGRCPQLGGAALCLTLPLGRVQAVANSDAEPPDAPARRR